MLDIGWTEMFVVAVVAIVVIGPKDLPSALRTAGRWASKARAAAREFQNSIDDMVSQAELDELRKGANEIRNFNPGQYVSDAIDPTGPSSGEAGKAGDDVKTDAEPRILSEAEKVEAGKAPPHSLMSSGGGVEQASGSDAPATPPERKANA